MKKILLMFAFVAVALGSASAQKVRVMSYNVKNGGGLDGIKDINPNAAESKRNTIFNAVDQFSYCSIEDTSKNCLDEITFDDITIEQAVTIRWYLK